MGNPLNWRNATQLVWSARELVSANLSNGNTVSYTYNADGIRTQKVYNGTTHNVGGVDVTGIKIVSDGVEQTTATNVKCVELTIQRAEAPVGTPIKVTYSVEGEGGLSVLGVGSTGLYSTHIPVKIVENNLTYKLASVSCK